MVKKAKSCDFDPPEPPTERIIRGLKIALDGERAAENAGNGNGFEGQLKEMISKAEEARGHGQAKIGG